MDLSDVNALGVIVFSCLKFGGYVLAFVFLKRIQPAVQGRVALMAGVRSVLGVVVGGALYFGWNALRHRFNGFYNLSYEVLPYYLVLSVLRVFIWVAVIHFFTRRTHLRQTTEWLYALGGSIWSCLMDFPAAVFTILIPGAVLFC